MKVVVSHADFHRHNTTTNPAPRFGYGMAGSLYDISLGTQSVYLFGGVSSQGYFFSETFRLDIDSEFETVLASGQWKYHIDIDVHQVHGSPLVQVLVDTSKMIAQGLLRPDCGDVRFLENETDLLDYWMDPLPGCNTASSSFWVSIGPETQAIKMQFGNSGVEYDHSVPPLNLFDVFEGFEDAIDLPWLQPGKAVVTNSSFAESQWNTSFSQESLVKLTGKSCLQAKIETNSSSSLSLDIGAIVGPEYLNWLNTQGYVLEVALYDSGCSGIHFISPDTTGITRPFMILNLASPLLALGDLLCNLDAVVQNWPLKILQVNTCPLASTPHLPHLIMRQQAHGSRLGSREARGGTSYNTSAAVTRYMLMV